MKIFLTGESGILGSDIKRQLTEGGHEVNGYNSTNIQLGNFTDVIKKVRDFKPEIVIHCAAMTNVDLCEDDKNSALLTNVIGSQNMSRAAAKVDAKMVYISSCGVYGGTKTTPYNEYDKTNPLTYHHFTKLQGEVVVKEQNDNFIIVRPGWLFGGTIQHKKNFVEARRKEALSSPVLKSAGDKFGSPTYTLHVAKQLLLLLNEDLNGTFNMVNDGCASRFDYVSAIVKTFNPVVRVEPVDSKSFPRKANMPDNECLENLNLNLINKNIMPGWQEALTDYIKANYSL